jgi:thiamine kinase-like enzyme
MSPEEIAAGLWPGRHVTVEKLGGGITNHNFKVAVDGDLLVLRVGGKDTDLLGIDRHHEYEAALLAAALGIGPRVERFEQGCLVTAYVEGEAGRADPGEVGPLLARLHAGASVPGRFDSFRVVEAYHDTASQRGVRVPAVYERALEIARSVERLRRAAPLVPCHNDLLAANFIHDGDRVWIVDWEYAGMGDPAFDLANYAVSNGLEEDGERELLDAYGGGDHDGLVLMRFMSDFREAMWGVVQQALSDIDFDFARYAAEHFERLERTASEPRFRAALGST